MNTRRRILGLAPIALLLLLMLALSGAARTPKQQATDTLFDTVQPTGTVTLTLPLTATLTATPGNAISVLATPSSTQVESPLATPITSTQSAMQTVGVSTIQATDIASSPLATPTPSATLLESTTPSPTFTLTATETTLPTGTRTVTPTPTAYVVLVVVTDTPTPLALVGARPLIYPTPTPTPDYVLVAAKIFDAAIMAAGWIWFLLGSLVFFVTAGVIAGLWFRQQERRRYDLMDEEDLDLDVEDFTTLPPVVVDDVQDDEWPESLP